ncbi:MAG: outer membrane protein assembly factor BamE [Halioglobus sp.]
MRLLLVFLAIACLSACGFVGFPGVYRIDVEQGNILTQETVDQLKPGMSRRQVRFILGTPLIEDTFNQNRWDYTYAKRNGLDILSESRLSVIFEGDSLVEVIGDYLPAAWSDQGGLSEPVPALQAAPGLDEAS